MAAKQTSLADITSQLYDILQPLDSEDRQKAIGAVLTLLGESASDITSPMTGAPAQQVNPTPQSRTIDAKSFFDQKDPRTKGEELVVAARYRELYQNAHEHSKEDLESVVTAARRNFDASNFSRDLDNAKVKGLFNKGKGHLVSYYGQKYVDALPDRDAVKKIRKPKTARRKTTKKKSTKKKPS